MPRVSAPGLASPTPPSMVQQNPLLQAIWDMVMGPAGQASGMANPIGGLGTLFTTTSPQMAQSLGHAANLPAMLADALRGGGSQAAMMPKGKDAVMLLNTMAKELGTRAPENTFLHELMHIIQKIKGSTPNRILQTPVDTIMEELGAWFPQVLKEAPGSIQTIQKVGKPGVAMSSYASSPMYQTAARYFIEKLGGVVPKNPNDYGKTLLILARKNPDKLRALEETISATKGEFSTALGGLGNLTAEQVYAAKQLVGNLISKGAGKMGPEDLGTLSELPSTDILNMLLGLKETAPSAAKAVGKAAIKSGKKLASRGR